MNFFAITVFSFLSAVAGQIYNVESAYDPYTTGFNSVPSIEQQNPLISVLSKSSGFTSGNEQQSLEEDYPETKQYSEASASVEYNKVLSPHSEVLQLIESFVRFKGEIGYRIKALISDNWDLIRAVYVTIVGKIGSLHKFTLIGIQIVRKVLAFASSLMVQWSVSKPALGLDLSLGGALGSFL